MSGLYEMKPIRLSKRSSYIRFTDEMERAMSTQRQIEKLRTPIVITYGTFETPEFQRQSREFAALVRAAGKPVELIEAPTSRCAKHSRILTGRTVVRPCV
jgi:arylformamidase